MSGKGSSGNDKLRWPRRDFLKSVGAATLGAGALSVRGGAADASPAAPRGAAGYPIRYRGPFAHGVASGDPLTDRVIIWTRVHERGQVAVSWSVATDPMMRNVVRSGSQQALARRDHTIKVDVTGLRPGTTYYYRFAHGTDKSVVGRTKTAPAGKVDRVRLAVLSCTSLWSSWWSGLGHIADRDDIDLVVHLGDYIYDFVDKDERVRSRDGFADMAAPDNRDWLNVAECRRRYALWRSDPKLTRAHQQHPWAMVWDNHDLDPEFGNEIDIPGMARATSKTTISDTARVFYEWTPTRPPRGDGSGEFLLLDDGSYPEPEDPLLIYRRLRFGSMADLLLTDSQSRLAKYGLDVDASHLKTGAPSLLGRKQFEWLARSTAESASDSVRWRLIGTQTMMSPLDIPDLKTPGDLPKAGLSRWAKYPAEMNKLIAHLRTGGVDGKRIRRNIILSGDTHCNAASDLVGTTILGEDYLAGAIGPNQRRGAQPGNAVAGTRRMDLGGDRNRSVAVEFAPSSMGRGGLDDIISGALGEGSSSASEVATAGSLAGSSAIVAANRNLQFLEWTEHGYGIVDLNAERAIFEFWWQNKFEQGSPDYLGYQMITWAENKSSKKLPRRTDQINDVRLYGMPIRPT